eukprot:NODE_129_length_18551_cov_0.317039.p5 type:complete len:259 gc:universal NODE_129_length_18551_cov_0.317039:8643-9419(+)
MTRTLRNIFSKLKEKSEKLKEAADAMRETIGDVSEVDISPASSLKHKWFTERPPVIYSSPKPKLGRRYTFKTTVLDYSVLKLAEIGRQLKGLSLEAAFDQMVLSSKKPSNAICNALIRSVREIKADVLSKNAEGKEPRPCSAEFKKYFELKKPLHLMTQKQKKMLRSVKNKSMPPSGLFIENISCGKRSHYKGVRHHGRGRMAIFMKPFSEMRITLVEANFMYVNRGNVSHPSKSPRHPKRVAPSRIYIGGLIEKNKT